MNPGGFILLLKQPN